MKFVEYTHGSFIVLFVEMQSVLGPTTMYNNISKKEESFYDNDPTSDSDDSYISIDQDTLPPPLPPPLRIHSSSELPFSSHTLQERKKFLKNVPPVPPKPNRQTMTYDSLSLKNNAVDINQTAETNDSSSVYEEIPDCRMEPTLSKIISPPPPPRINKSLPSPCHYESSLHCIAPNEEYIPTSDEMSLGEFVSKYQNDFPVRIRVSRGFYGTTDQWSISEGEYFNIHFLKKTKVISALDGCFGCYNIPINSSATFGFLYMENDDINEGIKGYNFPTAGDILEASNPPQIVKVQLNYGKSTEQSIRVGDLLIIQGNKGRLRKTLKCLNVKTREKKLLQSNCKGSFTTCPKDTQLFLPEIIEHFKLPTNFVMYINTDSIVNSEEMSFSHRVQLSHCSIETSLIATQLDRRINDGGTPSIIEIPMDLDIGVELVIPRDDEAAQLYEETGKLYETLDIATIQTIPSNVGSLQRDPTTAEALVACHKKNKNVGIEIQQPPRYFKGKVANTSIFKVPNESICPSYVKQNSTCGSTSATILSLSKSPSNVIYKKMENLKSTMEEHSNELKSKILKKYYNNKFL